MSGMFVLGTIIFIAFVGLAWGLSYEIKQSEKRILTAIKKRAYKS